MSSQAWHALSVREALERLGSSREGLGETEATRRLAAWGRNLLPQQATAGVGVLFLRQFRGPLAIILILAAVASAAAGDLLDAAFIVAVLLIDALLATVQEGRAEAGAAGLRQSLRLLATVQRPSGRQTIDAADLTCGDVVLLESGRAAPADLRLIDSQDLQVDESTLTGESTPVRKGAVLVLDPDTPLADRRNMAFAGTITLAGRGAGVVCAVGAETELGAVARSLGGRDAPPPLLVRMRSLTRRIAWATLAGMVLLGAVQAAGGVPLRDIFLLTVALAVSAIPEGLPLAVTAALAVASSRMARRQVIVRRLPAVEGLGSCTIIASDKTGTLTVNRLTVRRAVLPDGATLAIGGEGLELQGQACRLDGGSPTPAQREALAILAEAGASANEATLRTDRGAVVAVGDTVDAAFLVLARKLGTGDAGAQERTGLLPYEPAQGFSAAVIADAGGATLYVKGAPERVAAMCGHAPDALVQADHLARQGYRVLALARRRLQAGAEINAASLQSLEWLGLVGLIDPLRREAADAVARCRSAGIEVRMVTGDHPQTALAIARDLAMGGGDLRVLTGRELNQLQGPDRDRAIAVSQVYARVEPAQKTLIVEALQRQGHFVAVTGDGVNDAPALRAAHVGVAMGASGTDAARSAADLIVADDNFATIVHGVEEGRAAYANIRKVVWLLISTAISEVILFALSLAFGLPMPLTPVQILWLNLVAEGVQDVALAFERKEPGLMQQPPRPPDQSLFDRPMIEQCLVTGLFIGVASFCLFAWLLQMHEASLETARNVVLLALISFQNAHALSCRSETRSIRNVPLAANIWLVASIVLAQAMHVAAMHLPILRTALDLEPVPLEVWAGLAVLATSVVLVAEGYKWARRRAG